MAENVRLGGVVVDYVARNSAFIRAASVNSRAMRLQGQAARDFDRAARRARAGARQLTQSITRLGGAFGALSIGGAVTALARVSRTQAQYGATLREVSIATGLTVEQLQLARRAFEGNGVAVDATDKALARLNRTLGEARTLATYRRQFEALGLSVEDLFGHLERGGTIFDVLLEVSDGLATLATQAERVEVAQQLLGRQGARLLPTLQQGSAAFLEQVEAQRRLGLVTEEQAAQLKALEQTYTDVGNALQTGLAAVVADNTEVFERSAHLIGEVIPRAFLATTRAVNFLIDNFQSLSNIVLVLFGIRLARGALGTVIANIGRLAFAVGGVRLAFVALIAVAKTVGRFLGIGLIIQGLLIAVDAVLALRSEFGGLRNLVDFVAISFIQAASNIVNAWTDVRDIIVGVHTAGEQAASVVRGRPRGVRPGGVAMAAADVGQEFGGFFETEAAKHVDYVSMFYSAERQAELREAALRGGETYADAFLERVRARFDLFLGRATAEGEAAAAAITSAEPIREQDVGFAAGAGPRVTRFAQTNLNLQREIQRSLEDQAISLQRQLDLVGLTGRELAIATAQQQVRARFADEELRLTREIADLTQRVSAAARAETDARRAGNSQLSASARSARESAEAQLRVAKENLRVLLQQAAAMDELAAAAARVAEAQAGIDALERGFDRNRETVDRLWQSANQAISGITTGFTRAEDAARSFGRTVLEEVIERLIGERFKQAIGNLINIGIGAFTGGSGGFPFFTAQTGGLRQGFGLVGEAGPELVDFRTPGRVYTADQLSEAISGAGRDVVVNFAPVINGGDEATIERVLLERLPDYVEVTRAVIVRDSGRPSEVSAAFAG